MTRQKVIEDFLNDKVTMLRFAVYEWRGVMYEVIPYKEILDDKTLKASHFVKFEFKNVNGVKKATTLYGIRELSEAVFNKRYC